mgnify:CR=1 FL=1
MFEIIFIVFISIYTFQTVLFIIGSKKKFDKVDYADLPSISILVAARNEEDNIIDCLESLSKLEYPYEKIEIIIIDDNSTDKTNQLAGQFIKDKEQFILIKPSQEIGSLKGKTNALANAIRVASGRVILTTDADCIVSPTWAIELASYYKKDVAMVCGYTDQFSDTNFGGMQSVDFIYLLMIAGGVMNFGKPLSCIGNNMSYRKSVYEEVGGYEALPFSVTEDFNLLMAMHRLKKYKIIYPLSPKGMVTSKPCDSLRLLLKQKKRWGVGGLKSDVVGFSVMATGFVTHIMMLLTPFFFTPLSLYLSLFKIGVDYFALKGVHEKLNLKLNFKHFLLWEIYFIFYVIALPFMTLPSQRVEWKGRVYN